MYGQEGCLGLRGIMKHHWNTFVKKLSKIVRNIFFFYLKGSSHPFFLLMMVDKKSLYHIFLLVQNIKRKKIACPKMIFYVFFSLGLTKITTTPSIFNHYWCCLWQINSQLGGRSSDDAWDFITQIILPICIDANSKIFWKSVGSFFFYNFFFIFGILWKILIKLGT